MKTFATLIFAFFATIALEAQEITVTGTVTDESNIPLIGVNVVITGSSNGTQTDFNGKYELKAKIGQKLKFSYVGYETVERKVKDKKPMNVQMHTGAQLESVVVTAYDASQIMRSKVSGVPIPRSPYPVNNQVSNNESYDKIEENIFKMVTTAPLSTFSIDVDKAGYSNIRRMINNGQKIPKDAVKIEEMINYFNYDYPQSKRNEPFSITTEVASSPWNTNTKLVKIGLKGKDIATENTPASNLVFLLDVSGSMNSENKLGLLKSAMEVLVDKLREEDKVSIVVYAGAAGTVLEPTNGNNKEKIMEAIDKLRAGGSTAGGEGIKLAYKIAEENFIKDGNNRVILATDGDFNVGASSDRAMEDLIEEKRESGVFLTCLGFGMGNYKDSKMETLADKGNGNHAYIDTMQEAKKVLGTEFFGTIYTIAKDVKLQVEFNPKKVQAYRLIGYENRLLNDEDFNDDTKDAGELGSGHTVTALYELIPVGVKSEYLKDIEDLKYTNTINTSKTDELLTVKFRYKEPDGDKSKLIVKTLKDNNADIKRTSEDFQFSAAVALFGQQLRDSDFIATKSREEVIRLAEAGRGKDKEGYRAEFIRLVKSYK
ncbi:von Willebrand factor type A domain-containing protein [uncultured Marixanthomonas sp.]|uniref:vWA domain-containing protein n=1 Tax=uncultured Marixanthomonas sp. TaxID=757245 RepID=UPI0030D90F89|tara:strand:- start:91689 stop:93485 length:1797 start_codon:yes stop_codon:yes gene_type:complete